MKLKKLMLCIVLVVATMLVTTNLYATALPWLDFGNNLVWDSNTNTLTDNGLAYVQSVTYRNGTTVPPPFPPSDPVIWSPVSLTLSFDGDNTNDTLTIGSWFSASLDIVGPAPDPLSFTPNPYKVRISANGLSINSGAGSQWADEFASVLNYSIAYPAELILSWNAFYDMGGGLYQVNANGKVAPVPEPGTLLLLGSGLMGAAFYNRKRRKK